MSQPEQNVRIHVPPPKVPCFRCKKSHDTAAAFLISCSKCERAWHHICHIPPVTEEEIMGRIDADKKGKRDAGIGSWQCRTCTKRSRTEPSSRPDLLNEGSAPLVPTLPLKAPQTLQNGSVMAALAPTVITIDSEDDDDVMSLDEPPKPVSKLVTKLVQPPTQKKTAGQAHGGQLPAVVSFSSSGAGSRRSTKQAPTSFKPVPEVTEPISLPATVEAPAPTQGKPEKGKKERALLTSYSHTPASEQSAAAQSSALSQSQEKGKSRTVTKIAKRASEKSRPAPFSLPATHGYGTGDSRSRTRDSVTLSSPPTTPIRPPSPRPPPTRTANPPSTSDPPLSQVVSPAPHSSSPPSPTTPPPMIDMRAIIADMRAAGKLAPPPTIEYRVSHLPEKLARVPHLAEFIFKRPNVRFQEASGSGSGEEEDEDSMEVDEQLPTESVPETRLEAEVKIEPSQDQSALDDPHNIDDLYGEIAPRFRDLPPPPPRLLYTGRDRRPPQGDDLALIFEKMAKIEERRATSDATPPVRPRKMPAKQLSGRELKKKQRSALNYFFQDSEHKLR